MDCKPGAFPQLGGYGDFPAVLLNEFACHHQPEAGSPMAFRTEKRSKKLFSDLRRHAGTVVRHLKSDALIILQRCFQGNAPFFGGVLIKEAGIDGVGHQVQQRLVNGARIHDHPVDGPIEILYNLDIVFQGPFVNEIAYIVGNFVGRAFRIPAAFLWNKKAGPEPFETSGGYCA
jgi:hypothetical protein